MKHAFRVSERKHVVIGTSIAVLAVVITGTVGHFFPIARVAENWAADIRVATLTPHRPQSADIVVITITDETLSSFPYRSPVDRQFLSDLVTSLTAKQPRIIGIDLLFDQPTEQPKDAVLRTTLQESPVPVVAGWGEARDGLSPRQLAFMESYLADVRHGIPVVLPDQADGTVRSLTLRRDGSRLSLVAEILNTIGVPLPDENSLTLRFRHGPDSQTPAFASYPAHTVSLLPDEWLAGKIVLIGADLVLTDRLRTPLSVLVKGGDADMAGVYIHAHALSQLLEQEYELHIPAWQRYSLMLALAILGVVVTAFHGTLVLRAVIPVSIVAGLWIVGLLVFQYSGLLLPLVVPTLTFVLATGLAYLWRWYAALAEKQFIRGAFAKYVAPSVVDYMTADPRRLHLAGERRDLTFLFTDIAGFTTLAERTEPMLLVRTMNEYLNGACDIIFAHGGTLDKIVGDALCVMFNAPLDLPDHPQCAVSCALELDSYFELFARRMRAQKINFQHTRIGINTGETVVGNYGGEKHFEYTATGDVINATARLESVNKQIGTRICVSGATAARCQGVRFRPIGELVLKGKTEPVAAFEPEHVPDSTRRSGEEYRSAYRLMEVGDPRSKQAFGELLENFPDDPLVMFHADRLARGESGCRIVMTEK